MTYLENIKQIPTFLDTTIVEAIKQNASDINIDSTTIRFRIDGELKLIATIPVEMNEAFIEHIKTLAGLRTDIHYVPQDSRFGFAHDNNTVDIRVSILPTHYGESATLRIITQKTPTSFRTLGFSDKQESQIMEAIQYSKSQGLVLVSAPHGHGTTSTLYTILNSIADGKRSIITLEDLVSYAIPNVRQIQIREKHGVTYANGLRSIIRQDPDVIMLGELRDTETAQIAVNVALTGHLMLSALDTKSALSTITRLIDMGVDPYLVASTLSCVVAQRLVRKICTKCNGTGAVAISLGQGMECPSCNGTGFHGRTAITEVLTIDEELRKYIMSRTSFSEITRYARSIGFTTMYEDGMEKVEKGITTKEEVLRVLNA